MISPLNYQNNPEKQYAVGDIVLFYSHTKPYAIPAQIVEFKNQFNEGETLVGKELGQLLNSVLFQSTTDMIVLEIENDKNILIHLSQFQEKNERLEYVSQGSLETQLNFKQQCEHYLQSRVSFDPEATYQLGLWCFIGLLHDQNLIEAKKLWESASEMGHSIAQCYLAEMFFSDAKDTEGKKRYFDLLVASAKGGYVIAQYSLGYFYSEAPQQDYTQAIYWYEQAVAQNYAQAQCNLADKYEHGLGVAQDYTKALELYKQAAEQDVPEAMYSIANMILSEKGLVKNLDLAKAYLKKASELEYTPAQELLIKISRMEE